MMSVSKHGLIALGLAVAAGMVGGCGDDENSDGNGGAGGADTGTGTSTSTATSTATGTSTGTSTTTDTGTGTGTGMGDGNDDFDEAIMLPPGVITPGDLTPADFDFDFYEFQGNEGDAIAVFLYAKTNSDGTQSDPFADGLVDTVVELYDANQNLIAVNDDPEPRVTQDSRLYTRLPATGTYYLRISDFCTWDSQAMCDADYYTNLVDTSYEVFLAAPLNFGADTLLQETVEPNDAQGTAANMKYTARDMANIYFPTTTFGLFTDNADVDGFNLNAPDNVGAGGTPVIEITPHTGGAMGNGSTTEIGLLELVEVSSGNIVAQLNPSLDAGLTLTPPIDVSADYLLRVQSTNGAVGSNPFYYFRHSVTEFLNEPESEGEGVTGANDVFGNADLLTANTDDPDFTRYFAQGTQVTGDVDVFQVAVPAAGLNYTATCGAERSGSGLRQLSFEVLNSSGGSVMASPVEGPAQAATISNQPAPNGETTLYIAVSSGTPSATVTSRFYRCGVSFFAPAP